MPISLDERHVLKRQLSAGIDALSLALDEAAIEQLLDYLALLIKWNKAYNLTAVRNPADMVTRHLLDSLAVLPYIYAESILDVGTGGGLPGVVIAICRPDCQVHLLDSNGKKTRFLFQVKTALGLDNVTVHHQRIEQHKTDAPYGQILSRAFASLADMSRDCAPLLAKNGRLLAMKGQRPDSELTELPASVTLCDCYALEVPGLDEQRHLVELAACAHIS